jgi:hypothetical protein
MVIRVIKSEQRKPETVHANGKTRPIRDEKGHFKGSESIHPVIDISKLTRKEMSDLNKKFASQTPQDEDRPKPPRHVNRGLSKYTLVSFSNGDQEYQDKTIKLLQEINDDIERESIINKPRCLKDMQFWSMVTPKNGKTYTIGVPKKENENLWLVRRKTCEGYVVEFTDKKPSPNDRNVECLMTLYDPKNDIIAIDRAIKRYKEQI